jgi:hypothetical protein
MMVIAVVEVLIYVCSKRSSISFSYPPVMCVVGLTVHSCNRSVAAFRLVQTCFGVLTTRNPTL